MKMLRSNTLTACALIVLLLTLAALMLTACGGGGGNAPLHSTSAPKGGGGGGGSTPVWTKSVAYGPVNIQAHEDFSAAIINGHPAIAFREVQTTTTPATYFIRYIRATNATGTEWAQPAVTIATAQSQGEGLFSPALADVNGRPAVAWAYRRNELLESGSYHNFREQRYARADDAGGSSWPNWVLVEAHDWVGGSNGSWSYRDPTLLMVNGQPAICSRTQHLGPIDPSLRFVRATDADGQTWGVGQIIDPTRSVVGSRAIIVNGNPAVVYNRQLSETNSTQTVFYLRAVDTDGTAWGSPMALASQVRPSLAIVTGNPAVAYDGASYRRSSDTNGAAWGSAVSLAGFSTVSLASVSGKPAIAGSLAQSKKTSLAYVDSKDTTGAGWNTSQTIETLNSSGYSYFPRLFDIGGKPAMAYRSGVSPNVQLKFAIQQ